MTPASLLISWVVSCAWWAAWLRVGLVLLGDAQTPSPDPMSRRWHEPEVLMVMARSTGNWLA